MSTEKMVSQARKMAKDVSRRASKFRVLYGEEHPTYRASGTMASLFDLEQRANDFVTLVESDYKSRSEE